MSDGNKDILKTLSAISESLKALEHAAHTMAKASVASVVYPNDTLQKLLGEYTALELADAEAFSQLTKAGDELKSQYGENSTFEQRAEQFGKSEAQQQNKPITDAMEQRKATMAACSAFRRKHPIVASLHDVAIRKSE